MLFADWFYNSFVRLVDFYFGLFSNVVHLTFLYYFLFSIYYLSKRWIYDNDFIDSKIDFPNKLCSHWSRYSRFLQIQDQNVKPFIIANCVFVVFVWYCVYVVTMWAMWSTLEINSNAKGHSNKYAKNISLDFTIFGFPRCESLLIKIFISADCMTLQIINRKQLVHIKRVCKVHYR